MNKFAIYGLSIALAAGFAACDGYEEPNPPAQSNPQGAILQASEVTLASAVSATEVYSLEQLNNNGEAIVLATITAPNLGEYYSYDAKAQLSNTGFNRFAELPVTIVPANEEGTLYNVTVAPDALQGVYYANISKGPKAKEVQVRFNLYTVSNGKNGNQVAQIGNEFYGPVTLTVLPFPSEMVIEDNYYLIGTACDWTVTKAIKLNHSDKSPYDDPVFSAKFDVTPGWWWKIIPESTFVTGNWVNATGSSFGPEENGDESLAGSLFGSVMSEDGEYTDSQAGCLNVTGPYLLTINMEDKTFEFNLTIECLYTPGNSNGWSQTASQCLWPDDSFVNYTGVAHLNGDFKFSSQPNWNGLNYGSTGTEGELTTDGGAGNLSAPVDAAYWCKVDIAALTYEIKPMTTLGLIGSATANGWDASTNLTPSADFLTWTGKVTIGEGEFKLRANDAWDIDFGGDMNNLTYKGANIAAPAAGTYNVTVDFSSFPYSITFVK